MNGKSLDIAAEKLAQIKMLFPEVFSEDKIDFQRLKQVLGEENMVKGEHYQLSWAGKSEARKEIQRQTTSTLVRGEELGMRVEGLALRISPPNPTPSSLTHIFIEGENLEVLRVLQKSYFGKVKMIYIDPPYNTGNDSFVYPDDYSERQDQYKKRTNSTNEAGFLNKQDLWKKNTKENGQFHSVWLSMMYVRLYLSKNLLRDDGVIFISIDDAEQANLKLLCDEIFGEENFLGDIIWNSTKSVTNTALISVSHTYNLCYFKNLEYFKKNRTEFRLPETGEGFANPDKDMRGVWKADPFQVGGWRPNQQYEITNPNTGVIYKPNVGCSWKNDFETFKKLIEDNRIVFGVGGEAGPQRKRFLSEAEQRGKVSKTLWTDLDTTSNATIDLKELMQQAGLFDNPKPCSLIKRFLQLGTKSDQNHIILDFFAGSGTTAQAVMELNEEDGGNRQFICVQMPEPTQENIQAYKAGYKTIAEITKARITKVIEKTKQTLRPTVLSYRLAPSNFKIWHTDLQSKEEIAAQLFALKDTPKSLKPTHIDLFTELCLKNGLDLGVSYKVENGFYKVDTLLITPNSPPLIWCCFEPFSPEMKNEIWQHKPQKIIFLNSCFTNDAELLNFKTEFSFLTIELV